jgi:hypothetical protein
MSIQPTVDIENSDLILTVDRDGLERLVELLMHPTTSTIAIVPGIEHPMTRPISSLSLRVDAEDFVEIKTGDDAASIAGSAAALARLAREISMFAEYNDLDEPGMHAHFGPDDGPASATAVRPDSRSLVIAGPVSDEPDEVAS